MIVVFDTNVIVEAIFWPRSTARRALAGLARRRFKTAVNAAILEEYSAITTEVRARLFPAAQPSGALASIASLTGQRPDLDALVLGPGVDTGIAIRYEDGREVGADRIVNAVAGAYAERVPLIIISGAPPTRRREAGSLAFEAADELGREVLRVARRAGARDAGRGPRAGRAPARARRPGLGGRGSRGALGTRVQRLAAARPPDDALTEKIRAADIILFATPVWWGGRSSLMQRVIERMDAFDEEYIAGGRSVLYNKLSL